MIDLLLYLTVIFALVPVYVLLGYPVLLWLLARTIGAGPPRRSDAPLPSVTMIVSCYNEQAVLAQKISNCLEIDYPADQLQFLFVSDASSDDTDAIVRASASPRVRLLRMEDRGGKTIGLNAAMQRVESDIVVFSDANAMYRADAVRNLVAPFADAEVGYVVGAALYDESATTASGRSEGFYWKHELWMKQQESLLHSVVGGDGAIYAIRRSLFWPFDPEDINDLVNPLQIVINGYRGVFRRDAVCFEHAAEDFEKEGRRKRRIVNRSFSAVLKHRSALNPLRNFRFAFALWSHKLLRWLLAPLGAIAGLGAIALGLLGRPPFDWLLPGLLGLLWLAVAGSMMRSRRSQPVITAVPYYAFMVAWQATLGLMDALRGRVMVTWEPPRTDPGTLTSRGWGAWSAGAFLMLLSLGIAWSIARLTGMRP